MAANRAEMIPIQASGFIVRKQGSRVKRWHFYDKIVNNSGDMNVMKLTIGISVREIHDLLSFVSMVNL